MTSFFFGPDASSDVFPFAADFLVSALEELFELLLFPPDSFFGVAENRCVRY